MSTSLHLLAASTLLAAIAFASVPQTTLAAPPAADTSTAAAPVKTRTPQRQRMADCSHQAKADGKKGAERKTFMSSCLKGHGTTAATNPPAGPKAKAKAAAPAGNGR